MIDLMRHRFAQRVPCHHKFRISIGSCICVVDCFGSHPQKGQRPTVTVKVSPTTTRFKPITWLLLKASAPLQEIPLNALSTASLLVFKTMNCAAGPSQRRKIFPTYQSKIKKNLKTTFSEMARLARIESCKEMTQLEKNELWWQKRDYDEFRKTARVITKAMLQGGSEIWLQKTTDRYVSANASGLHGVSAVQSDSLSVKQQALQHGDVHAKEEYEQTRDQWWHRFGHSRRGLEHLASIDEGRQRHTNVVAAKKAVIDEQRRQRLFGPKDANKLRSIYIHYSSWARDLAVASGESDADAVRSSFDHQRKSREFYLHKRLSRSNNMAGKRKMPVFMKPAPTIGENRLDENTDHHIRFREIQKKEAASPKSVVQKKLDQEKDNEMSMAKMAAGFSSADDKAANMSAVLTGMGLIPKSSS